MKPLRILRLCAVVSVILVTALVPSANDLLPGAEAPDFSAVDTSGTHRALVSIKNRPMIVLYFFDPQDKASLDGLQSLGRMLTQYRGADLIIWAITAAPEKEARRFAAKAKAPFPILLDPGEISRRYGAEMVLPTACVIGPGLRILDYIQGGGKATENLLLRLAQRQLQRKDTRLAKALSKQLTEENPKNTQARLVQAYALMKEGRLQEAETLFKKLMKHGGKDEILAKEGLAALYERKGQPDKAMEVAQEVERKAPKRSFVHVTKGNILLAQNKVKEAKREFQAATQLPEAEPYQQALPYNQLGRLYAREGDYSQARELYDQAIDVNPYFVEATSNKGLTYEKERKWDEALKTYRKAAQVNPNDAFVMALVRRVEELLKLEKEKGRNERLDRLVKELSKRYRKKAWKKREGSDEWTSRPMVVSFVDIQEKGMHPERDGFSEVLLGELTTLLNESKRVKVVERVVMERLLEELNIGTSELADPETALKLGRILASKLVGTGSILFLPQGAYLSMRFVDSETTGIPLVINRPIDTDFNLKEEMYRLNREILSSVIEKYPLRGYIVSVNDDQVMINIGRKHGVVTGTRFEIIEEQKPVSFKGRTLTPAPKVIGLIEINRVEGDLAYGTIVSKQKPIRAESKVVEKSTVSASDGGASNA